MAHGSPLTAFLFTLLLLHKRKIMAKRNIERLSAKVALAGFLFGFDTVDIVHQTNK